MSLPNSLLSFVELGIAPYALRGIAQTLQPIAQASNLRRTANGSLEDVSDPLFQKYKSTIRCTDQQSPGLDGVWPGLQLTMWCAVELSSEGNTGTVGLFRPAVPNSIRQENGFTFYRPILIMRVLDYQTSFDEWPANLAWQLDLEEV